MHSQLKSYIRAIGATIMVLTTLVSNSAEAAKKKRTPAQATAASPAPDAKADAKPDAKAAAAAKTEAAKPEAKAEAAPVEAKKTDEPKAVDFKAGDVWNVDIFSREDHKVLVLQDRRYTKAGRFEVGLMGGATSYTAFYSSYSYGAQMDYYFNEYLGIDAFYSQITSSYSPDGTQLNEFFDATNFPTAKEYQKPERLYGAAVIWAPIYGKFAFFRKSIIHFDFFGTAGVSVMDSRSYFTTDATREKTQSHIGSLLSLGMRVFLSKNFSLRSDFRHNIFQTHYDETIIELQPENNVPAADIIRQAFHYTLGASFIF